MFINCKKRDLAGIWFTDFGLSSSTIMNAVYDSVMKIDMFDHAINLAGVWFTEPGIPSSTIMKTEDGSVVKINMSDPAINH